MGLLGQPVCEREPKEPGLFSLRKQKNLAIPTQLCFPPASVGIKAAGFLTLLGVLSLNTMGAESDLEEEKQNWTQRSQGWERPSTFWFKLSRAIKC